MNDLNRLPLDALMWVAKQTNLVDECRKTEWVVVLEIEDEELVMNHTNAHIFLQGMIRGSLRRQQLSEKRVRRSLDEMAETRAKEDHRKMIG